MLKTALEKCVVGSDQRCSQVKSEAKYQGVQSKSETTEKAPGPKDYSPVTMCCDNVCEASTHSRIIDQLSTNSAVDDYEV